MDHDPRPTTPVTLVALCGRSFSGKSTLGRELAVLLSAELVSLDAINAERGLRGGEGIPASEWMRTNDEALARAGWILHAGRSVVVDDTNSLRFLRDRWRTRAEERGARFALIYLRASDALIRRRLEANRRTPGRHDVTDAVLEEHFAQFEEPTVDEHPIVVDAEPLPAAADVLRILDVRGRRR